jgi:hypothetical protein
MPFAEWPPQISSSAALPANTVFSVLSFRLHPPSDVSNPLLRADASRRSSARSAIEEEASRSSLLTAYQLGRRYQSVAPRQRYCPLPNTAPSNQVRAKHRLSDVIDRLALCRLISENTTVVSNSYPHASQDHKLPTHRSLTYLESLTAIEAAWQLGQRWCAFSLIRFTSICHKDVPSHLQKMAALSRLP